MPLTDYTLRDLCDLIPNLEIRLTEISQQLSHLEHHLQAVQDQERAFREIDVGLTAYIYLTSVINTEVRRVRLLVRSFMHQLSFEVPPDLLRIPNPARVDPENPPHHPDPDGDPIEANSDDGDEHALP